MRLLATVGVLAVAANTVQAGTIPASVVPTFTTPNDYIFHIDSDPASEHYYPFFKAFVETFAIDSELPYLIGTPNGYHSGYVNLGFADPFFSGGDRDIFYWNCKNDENFDCDNGFATSSAIHMPVSVYREAPLTCTRSVLGHELGHHMSNAYKEMGAHSYYKWVFEGHARVLQDKIYFDLDIDPDLSCPGDYPGQVKSYLDGTNIPIYAASYSAALFWTYLMEQYGQLPGEPIRGVDFLREWYENAAAQGPGGNSVTTTDLTIKQFEASHSFKTAFRNFAIANYIKDMDLENVSDAFRERYSYRDTEPVGSITPDPYEPGEFAVLEVVGDLEPEAVVPFAVVNYGIQGFKVTTNNCSPGRLIRVSFATYGTNEIAKNKAGFSLVVGRGLMPRPALFYKKLAENWSVEFLQQQNQYDNLTMAIAAVDGPALGNITVECDPPPPAPQLPLLNPLDPQTPGPPDEFATVQVGVVLPPPEPGQPPISAAPGSGDLELFIGGVVFPYDAIPGQDGNDLLIVNNGDGSDFLDLGEGSHDIAVRYGGQTTTVPDALVLGPIAPDVLLALDTSSTMLNPPDASSLDAVKQAARGFVDALPEAGQIGLIEFAGNDFEPDDDAVVLAPLKPADTAQRDAVKVGIDGLLSGPNRFTSIGDALAAAEAELQRDGSSGQSRHVVLVSDGAENEGAFWADLRDAFIAGGTSVHAIALGPLADQGLLAAIAKDTGGLYEYVDVGPLAADVLDLHRAFFRIAAHIGNRRDVARGSGLLTAAGDLSIEVQSSAVSLLLPAVQSAREAARRSSESGIAGVRVFRPDGSEVLDGVAGAQIIRDGPVTTIITPDYEPGAWRYQITPTATASDATVEVSVSARLGRGVEFLTRASIPELQDEVVVGFEYGDPLQVNALLIDPQDDIPDDARIIAEVERPDGMVVSLALEPVDREPVTESPLTDSFAINFEKVVWHSMSGASPTGISDQPGQTPDRGSYNVKVFAEWGERGSERSLLAQDAIHVGFPIVGDWDGDGDELPDRHENRHWCLDAGLSDATLDPDRDGLPSITEFDQGTLPCLADTDGGGEDDGSEVVGGRSPLDPDDDAIAGIAFAYVAMEAEEHQEYTPVPASALRIRLGPSPSAVRYLLRRGTAPNNLPLVETIEDPLVAGEYIDRGLTPGETYYYQLVAEDAAGRHSAPTPIFSGTARNDGNRPVGSLILNGGKPRTQLLEVPLGLAIYNKDAREVEYLAQVDGYPPASWLPFSEGATIMFTAVGAPTRKYVSVIFRDGEGTESETYHGSIVQHPRGSLGSVRGRVRLQSGVPDSVWVRLGFPHLNEASAVTDADGNFQLGELKPDTYTLVVEHPQFAATEVENILVPAGGTLDIGEIFVLNEDEVIFATGFEQP